MLVLVLFAPVFPSTCNVHRRCLFKNEGCGTKSDEGEDGKKTENPVGENLQAAKRVRVETEFGKPPAGMCCCARFRSFLPDGILGPACQHPLDNFAGRDVVEGDGEERYCCEYRKQDKRVVPYSAQAGEQVTPNG